MKKLLFVALAAITIADASAQRFMSRTGRVTFYSSTPLENIEAINNEAACVIDGATGEVAFIVPIRSFKFEKELMQEHFNENYMESDKYPKSEFKGRITDLQGANFGKDGSYKVHVAGKLTMHGVTRDISTPGTITVKGGAATTFTKFMVQPADYGIKIPKLVAGKIAEAIEVTVNATMARK
jgi:polyisoprenoid-binding protein YceI